LRINHRILGLLGPDAERPTNFSTLGGHGYATALPAEMNRSERESVSLRCG